MANTSAEPKTLGTWRAVLLVAMLTVVATFNYLDRDQFNILSEPIRRDLHLLDSQIGLLQGLSFAVVFSLLALPISHYADRGRQKTVILASIVIWSLMTTWGGFAQSFFGLAVMRMGVALGEAGLNPASHSLLSKHLKPYSRGRALAVLGLGLPLGGALGAIIGGIVNDAHGWRVAFLILGPATLILVPFVALSLPRDEPLSVQIKQQPLLSTVKSLWKIRGFRTLAYGGGTASVYGYAQGTFSAMFLMRRFSLPSTQVGWITGLSAGIVGSFGLLLSGLLYDWTLKRFPGKELRPTVIALVLAAIIAPFGFLASNWLLAACLIGVAQLLYLFIIAPIIAAAMSIAPPEKRGVASSLITLCGVLGGASLGPFLAGSLSDLLAPTFGIYSIGCALAVMPVFLLIGAFFLYRFEKDSAGDVPGVRDTTTI